MLSSFVRDSGWNLAGFLVPAVAAFASTPWLFRALGAERFGLLSIAWAVLGMVSVFDLGIGRASTRWIADLRASDDSAAVASASATALFVSAVLAAAVTVGLGLMVAAGFGLTVSAALADEARRANYLLAAGLGVSVYGSALRGALEGFSDFRAVNVVKIPSGVAGFVLPCVAALVSPDLSIAVAALVASRFAANVAMARRLRHWTSSRWADVDLRTCASLMGYGGWITVSSVLGPLIVYADRFVIGSLISAAAVAYFSVPADALSRVLIVPVSIASATFPAIVSERARAGNVRQIVGLTTKSIAVMVIPPTIVAAMAAHGILELWMGPRFADESTGVFRVLAAGFCLNALAQVPFLALQAVGAARSTALWHLVQLVPYLAALAAATHAFGILGTAWVWTARATVDLGGMWFLLHARLRVRR
jgi:O-antigen/teichoic acid export membrane protein